MERQGTTVGLVTLLALTLVGGLAQGQTEDQVLLMFDLGDGSVYWQESVLSDNRTGFRATDDEAQALELAVALFW